VENQII